MIEMEFKDVVDKSSAEKSVLFGLVSGLLFGGAVVCSVVKWYMVAILFMFLAFYTLYKSKEYISNGTACKITKNDDGENKDEND